jgi:hypothetical protein
MLDDGLEECRKWIEKSKMIKKINQLHQPGIEPGSVPWQGTILPLDHWCVMNPSIKYMFKYLLLNLELIVHHLKIISSDLY